MLRLCGEYINSEGGLISLLVYFISDLSLTGFIDPEQLYPYSMNLNYMFPNRRQAKQKGF